MGWPRPPTGHEPSAPADRDRSYRSGNPRSQVVISGLGMVCSLGPDAVTACAAARAGLTRTRPLEYAAFDPVSEQPEPILGHSVSTLTRGFRGVGRLARLAIPALEQVLSDGHVTDRDMADTALVLVLPSGFYLGVAEALKRRALEADEDPPPLLEGPLPVCPNEQLRERCRTRLLPRLFASRRGCPAHHTTLQFEDQAGLGTALLLATDLLARGEVARCIVGGVDSMLDPEMLGAADGLDTLKTPTNPVGFLPGEAAAFALLEPAADAERAGRRSLAAIESVARRGPGPHQFAPRPAHGRVLADALAHAVARSDTASACGSFLGGCNGTEWSATQWGHAVTTLPAELRRLPQWHPAAAFGETGAASGFLALAVAVRAHVCGYAPTGTTVLWTQSPSGDAAAVGLHAV